MWLQKVGNDSFEMFSYTQNLIVEKKFNVYLIKPIGTDHLACMKNNFQKYFLPELDNNQMDWITNPFMIEISNVKHLSLKAQEEYAELSCDSSLKNDFKKKVEHILAWC